jgi:hypothetical protein
VRSTPTNPTSTSFHVESGRTKKFSPLRYRYWNQYRKEVIAGSDISKKKAGLQSSVDPIERRPAIGCVEEPHKASLSIQQI